MKQPVRIKLPNPDTAFKCIHENATTIPGDDKSYDYKFCRCGFKWKHFLSPCEPDETYEKINELLTYDNKIINSKKFIHNMEVLYSIVQDVFCSFYVKYRVEYFYCHSTDCDPIIAEIFSILCNMIHGVKSIKDSEEFDIDLTDLKASFDRIKSLYDGISTIIDVVESTSDKPGIIISRRQPYIGMVIQRTPINTQPSDSQSSQLINNASAISSPNHHIRNEYKISSPPFYTTHSQYPYLTPSLYSHETPLQHALYNNNGPSSPFPQQPYPGTVDIDPFDRADILIKVLIESLDDSMPSFMRKDCIDKLKRIKAQISDKLKEEGVDE